jgi:eukaryotic-like serine/threonine-protein kinase
LTGRRLAGRYLVEGVLGVGGMGVVYRARDEELELPVALKVLRSDLGGAVREDRFRREIVLARQVSHPHVVRIHDLGRDGETTFLTMDLVEGRSLRSLIEEGPLPAAEARRIGAELAAALAEAHRQGVVHRDLKPENVLIAGDGRAMITDFGVARSLAGPAMTRDGALVGTLAYLSPEQARGEAVDGRTDLYALGLLLHEMVTGDLPFTGGTREEVLAQRLTGRAATSRVVDRGLRRVVDRLLAADPAARPQDAEEARAALVADGEAARRRSAWARPAMAVAAVAVVAVAGWWWLASRSPGPSPAAAGAAVSLAVLPFADETGRAELGWVSRGAAEVLAELMAESPAVEVTDPLRVFAAVEDLGLLPPYGEAPLRTLVELLGAERLVLGRVRGLEQGVVVEAWVVAPGLPDGDVEPVRAEIPDLRRLDGGLASLVAALAAGLRLEPGEVGEAAVVDPTARAAYDRGLQRLVDGNALDSVADLERAVEVAPSFTAAWLRLGEAYAALGRETDAAEALRRAEGSVPRLPPRLALEIAARQAALVGDPGEAQRLFTELVRRFPGDFEARLALAEAYGEAGELAEARQHLGQLATGHERHPRVWYLLAKYAIQSGEAQRAVDDYLVRALVLHNRLDNEQGRADVLNALGVAYDQLGRLDEAIDHYGRAAELRQRIGDRRGYATSLRNLAALHGIRSQLDRAAAELDEAAALLEEIGDRRGLGDLVNDRGFLEEVRGRFREALEHYRRSLALRRELGDRRGMAESANNVAFAYYQLGDLDNAAVYWGQSLDLFTAGGNREGVVLARQGLGLLAIARGEWPEATRHFVESLAASRELGMQDSVAVSLGSLGRLAQLEGRPGAALRSYAEAQQVVAAIGDPRGQVEYTLAEAEVRLELGDLTGAAAQLDAARSLLPDSGNAEQRARHDVLRGRLGLARGAAAEAGRWLASARQAAEASGARIAALEVELLAAALAVEGGAAEALALAIDAEREATAIGHLPLRLAAGEMRARAALGAADPAAAVSAAEVTLRQLRPSSTWEGEHRLRRLRAAGLAALGDGAGADEERRRADAAWRRLRGEVPAELRPGFEERSTMEDPDGTGGRRAA